MKTISDEEAYRHNQIIQFQPIGLVENEFNTPARPEEMRLEESRIVLNPSL